MSTFILFGEVDPVPVIPGYTVSVRKDDWMKAFDEQGRIYIVGESPESFMLWEFECRDEWRTKSNHDGMRLKARGPLAFDNAVVVQKEKP